MHLVPDIPGPNPRETRPRSPTTSSSILASLPVPEIYSFEFIFLSFCLLHFVFYPKGLNVSTII